MTRQCINHLSNKCSLRFFLKKNKTNKKNNKIKQKEIERIYKKTSHSAIIKETRHEWGPGATASRSRARRKGGEVWVRVLPQPLLALLREDKEVSAVLATVLGSLHNSGNSDNVPAKPPEFLRSIRTGSPGWKAQQSRGARRPGWAESYCFTDLRGRGCPGARAGPQLDDPAPKRTTGLRVGGCQGQGETCLLMSGQTVLQFQQAAPHWGWGGRGGSVGSLQLRGRGGPRDRE